MRRTKRLFALILLIVAAGTGVYLYRFGWTKPKLSQLGQVFSSEDPTITSRVQSDLKSSRLLTGYDINVKTEDGVVTVAGQVPSEDLRSLAAEITRRSTGVRDVKNLIIINNDARPAGGNPKVQDLDIKTALLQGLARSPELAGKKIEVNVENQVVTLTGAVDSAQQRLIAEQIARASDGVSSVNDVIAVAQQPAVQPSPSASGAAAEPNADLAKHVEFEMYSTGAFDLNTMKITADNGVVTLAGTVRSRAEQLLAERVAQSVSGVKTVANDLKTSPAAARH